MATQPLAERQQNATAARWSRWLVITLTILAWLGLGIVLWWLTAYIIGTLIMVIIAVLLSYALYPLSKLLQRIMPRTLAILTVYILIFGAVCALLYAIVRTAMGQVTDLTDYIQRLLQSQGEGQSTPLEQVLLTVGVTQEQLTHGLEQIAGQLSGFAVLAGPLITGILNAFLNTLLVAVLSIYALFSGPRIINWLRYKTPIKQRQHVIFTLDVLKRVVGGYIRGQMLLSTTLSTITGVFMAIIGVPYSLFIGILAFFLSFIPTIGAFTTGAICILLALTVSPTTALLAVGFLVFLQILEGQVLTPRILGPAVGLHPMVALIALIAGGELFGLVGALFASLIAGLLQAVLVAVWTTWKGRHPDEFLPDDHEQFIYANKKEEQGLQSPVPTEKIETKATDAEEQA